MSARHILRGPGRPRSATGGLLAALLVAATVLVGSQPGDSAFAADTRAAQESLGSGLRLVMVDDVGCVWCRKWDAEVGGAYERSPVGQAAPLARRAKRHPDLAPYEPLAYTPTFILLREGREIGRIVGYSGADFFWTDIEKLVAKAGPIPAPEPSPSWPGGQPRDASADTVPKVVSGR